MFWNFKRFYSSFLYEIFLSCQPQWKIQVKCLIPIAFWIFSMDNLEVTKPFLSYALYHKLLSFWWTHFYLCRFFLLQHLLMVNVESSPHLSRAWIQSNSSKYIWFKPNNNIRKEIFLLLIFFLFFPLGSQNQAPVIWSLERLI